MFKFKHSIFLFNVVFLFISTSSHAVSDACGNSPEARKLVQLIMQDAKQKRKTLRCNPILVKAADSKAKLMSERGMVRHNLGGSPNGHLRDNGYKLPPYYGSAFSNQVEAIAGGYESAEEVWKGFKNSKPHRQHLLGELDFYLEQDEIGVAFYYEWHSPHVEYWVVYLTKGYEPNQKGRFDSTQVPNKSNLILKKQD